MPSMIQSYANFLQNRIEGGSDLEYLDYYKTFNAKKAKLEEDKKNKKDKKDKIAKSTVSKKTQPKKAEKKTTKTSNITPTNKKHTVIAGDTLSSISRKSIIKRICSREE